MRLSFKKILCMVLCAVSVCGALAGCGNKDSITIDKLSSNTGNRWGEVKLTDKSISQSGISGYKIVVAQNAGSHTVFAANELQTFIKQAGAAEIEIVYDTGLTYSPTAKYLSVGKNQLSDDAGIVFDYNVLGYNGLRIHTQGDTVFMGGAGEFGNMNAVYKFLEYTVGFEAFTAEIVNYNTMKDVPLLEFGITDIPDIQWRVGGYYSIMGNSAKYAKSVRRLRYNTPADMWMAPGNLAHNSFLWIPKREFMTNQDPSQNHPKWFSDDATQLCYTAHGDLDEFESLTDTALEKIKDVVKANPHTGAVTFAQEDYDTWCTCEACAAERAIYGTDSAVLIKFANTLSDKLNAWIKDNDEGVPQDRRVTITVFAYMKTEKAPVEKDATGAYKPIDESVIVRDDVSIWYAPIYAEYTVPFTHERNLVYADLFERWSALSDSIYLWSYNTAFQSYLFPYDTFDTTKINYAFIREKGVESIFDQAQWDSERSTAMTELKIYLNSKLGWDVNADMNELIDRWFTGVFGAAAQPMQEYFSSLRVWLAYLKNHQNLTGGIFVNLGRSQYWPKPILDDWNDKITQAYAAIEYLKAENTERYDLIAGAINRESIFIRYSLITFYPGEYSDDTLVRMRADFSKDLTASRITAFGEGTPAN